jgi:hypothetical protein
MATQNAKKDNVANRPGTQSQNDKLREMRPYKWAGKKGTARIQKTPKPKV